MDKQKSKVPPVDTKGESERAALTLKRCRKLMEKESFSPEWQRWVAESLLAGIPAAEDAAGLVERTHAER